jgi:hypothetical protein
MASMIHNIVVKDHSETAFACVTGNYPYGSLWNPSEMYQVARHQITGSGMDGITKNRKNLA